ncbi:MAG: transposase [Gammaproteobacteria bacterium]|nr:transposase [Gammaproteobacteria bacterium]
MWTQGWKSTKGKPPKTTAHNLHEAFQNYENEILRFARNPFCPYSNNAAERFHRMSKVKQKMSGTFRSVKMAQAYCRVTSYLQTMNQLGYNPLTAIEWMRKGDAVRIHEEKL